MPDQIKLGRRPAFPITISLEYYRQLKIMVTALNSLCKEIVVPELPRLIAEAQSVRPKNDRMDSYASQVQDLIDRLKEKFDETYSEEYIKELVEDFAQRTDNFNFKSFQYSIGADENFLVPIFETFFEQEFDAFVVENVRLIKTIPQQYGGRIQNIVTEGIQQGQLNAEIAEQIHDAFRITKNQAKRIARDQVAKYNSSLTQLRQQSVGIENYQWSTSRDEKVRPTHAANEGVICRWDKPPVATGHPGHDINCRCVAIPVMSFKN